jgi:hypothetical protein
MDLDNGQTRMIAGSDEDVFMNRSTVGEVGEYLLNKAKHNLKKYFFFVGVQERFDESFILWARKIGWDRPTYLSANRRQEGLPEETIDPSLLSRIAENNHIDAALYEYCIQRFEDECNRMLPNREDELAALAVRNVHYARTIGSVQRVWDTIKPGLKYET